MKFKYLKVDYLLSYYRFRSIFISWHYLFTFFCLILLVLFLHLRFLLLLSFFDGCNKSVSGDIDNIWSKHSILRTSVGKNALHYPFCSTINSKDALNLLVLCLPFHLLLLWAMLEYWNRSCSDDIRNIASMVSQISSNCTSVYHIMKCILISSGETSVPSGSTFGVNVFPPEAAVFSSHPKSRWLGLDGRMPEGHYYHTINS